MKTSQLHQNIIITILLQTIGKATTTIAEKKESDLLTLLKDILSFAVESIKNESFVYRNLEPSQAEAEIKMLDNMYKMLSTVFNMLFSQLDTNEIEPIKMEYDKLIALMEDIRESLELFCDIEFMESLKAVSNGDYSDFIRVA